MSKRLPKKTAAGDGTGSGSEKTSKKKAPPIPEPIKEEIITVHFIRYDREIEMIPFHLLNKNQEIPVLKSGNIVVTENDDTEAVYTKVTILLKEFFPTYKGGFEIAATYADVVEMLRSKELQERNLYARLTNPLPGDDKCLKQKRSSSPSDVLHEPLSKKPRLEEMISKILSEKLKTFNTRESSSADAERCAGGNNTNNKESTRQLPAWQSMNEDQDPMEYLQQLINKHLSPFVCIPALHETTRKIATACYFSWLDKLPYKHPGHIIIVGNPGVGKTTGARALASFMADARIVRLPIVIEAHRDDLIDRYVGGTELKTNIVIHSAKGGVVIFDEVYALNKPSSPNDSGKEALMTIMKYMTDEEAPVFMFLGYKDSMRDFVNMNPGFQRRIRYQIDMKDYDATMLTNIVNFRIAKMELRVEKGINFEQFFKSLSPTYLQLRNASVAIQLIERAVENAQERTLSLPHSQRKGASRTILKTDFDAAFAVIRDESRYSDGGIEDLCPGLFI